LSGRWTRTLQVLADERIPFTESPQSPSRMTPATTALDEAVVNHQVTYDGDKRLARHVSNAVLKADSRGTRLSKEHKDSRRRIDLAAAAVMARPGTRARERAESGDLRARLNRPHSRSCGDQSRRISPAFWSMSASVAPRSLARCRTSNMLRLS
jgi:phage terminase large subunit-like protein